MLQKSLTKDKHSRLFDQSIHDKEKEYSNISL
jgi:hypothetical protein